MKKIMIIEDGKSLNKMLTYLFLSRGYSVKSAHNGREALEVLNCMKFDAIILDLMMPEMDGYEFCGLLKEDEAHKDTPVIVISAVKKEVNEDRLRSIGISDYLEKPFSSMELLSIVSNAVAGEKE